MAKMPKMTKHPQAMVAMMVTMTNRGVVVFFSWLETEVRTKPLGSSGGDGGDGPGGGDRGGLGGGEGTSRTQRAPQSSQSVPNAQYPTEVPSPPSSQKELLASAKVVPLMIRKHVFSQRCT